MPFLLYALMTWTTRERAPLITERIATFLRKAVADIAQQYGARVLELGIVDDHVHVLLRLPARFDIPRLAQGLKGATARIANRDGAAGKTDPLHWASGYDLRSVVPRGVNDAKEYLRAQLTRHPERVPRPRA